MPFQDLTHAVMEQFPRVRIRYKDQSLFMQIWAFFDKTFLSESFTFQSTIYFPSQHFTKLHPVTSAVLLLHELVRLHASKRKACLSSLYVTWKLSQRLHFHPHLQAEAQEFVRLLKRPWISSLHLQEEFQQAIFKIQAGERPCPDPIFDVLDQLITHF